MSVSEVENIDCMIGMAKYPDKFFDLAIVDPPYGIGAGNGTGRSIRVAIEKGKIKGGEWDREIPSPKYFNELFRVSKHQIIWGGNYFPLPIHKGFIIWDKGETMYERDFAECEQAWISFDKPAKIFKKSPTQLERIHPTQKPISLYKWLFENYAKKGDKILDTHLGSGSSRIAAYHLGFHFTGFEIDQDYFNQQEQRFQKAIHEPLFINIPPKQQTFF
jgi:site-specific DNA-methyltransferase (adenine-specific)